MALRAMNRQWGCRGMIPYHSFSKRTEGSMAACKNCQSELVVKNGFVRGKQRFFCKDCGLNFVEGDARTNEKTAAKKALCVILYSLGKASFNMLARICDSWPSLVYRWIAESGATPPEGGASGEVRQMEFDEMQQFIRRQKENFGPSGPLTVAHGELWPGCPAIVIFQLPDDCAGKRDI
jgi:transposase-like protein